jgi:alanyl-tRNA synthetase
MGRPLPLTADQVRHEFLRFQTERGHARLSRSPLVPRDDPTTLFTGSGMQPLLPYLLGAEHPDGRRLTDSQTCLRGQDIEAVGDNRHTTFFEMLGNWSLGDYFKAEQLPAVWTLLTERLGLDPARIFVSCFAGDAYHDIPKDTESAAIWRSLFQAAGLDATEVELGTEERGAELGSGEARIVFYGKKNWWCRGGTAAEMPVGDPGGPDSELFYLYPDVPHDPRYGEHCHPNCDCGRYVEIGNSVFMEYRKTASGFERLPARNVDFGGGLERISAAVLGTPDVYRISLLRPLVEHLEQLSGLRYEDRTYEFRVIADHLRGATFLAVDGVRPSNKEQGYVMRRLVRRAIRMALILGIDQHFFDRLVSAVADMYQGSYPEVGSHRDTVIEVLVAEERRFRNTLEHGLEQLETLRGHEVGGHDLFVLHDTYGFPVELSVEEARRSGFSLAADWSAEYHAAVSAQRARSQAAARARALARPIAP